MFLYFLCLFLIIATYMDHSYYTPTFITTRFAYTVPESCDVCSLSLCFARLALDAATIMSLPDGYAITFACVIIPKAIIS